VQFAVSTFRRVANATSPYRKSLKKNLHGRKPDQSGIGIDSSAQETIVNEEPAAAER
jgi:hypothetical protein